MAHQTFNEYILKLWMYAKWMCHQIIIVKWSTNCVWVPICEWIAKLMYGSRNCGWLLNLWIDCQTVDGSLNCGWFPNLWVDCQTVCGLPNCGWVPKLWMVP